MTSSTKVLPVPLANSAIVTCWPELRLRLKPEKKKVAPMMLTGRASTPPVTPVPRLAPGVPLAVAPVIKSVEAITAAAASRPTQIRLRPSTNEARDRMADSFPQALRVRSGGDGGHAIPGAEKLAVGPSVSGLDDDRGPQAEDRLQPCQRGLGHPKASRAGRTADRGRVVGSVDGELVAASGPPRRENRLDPRQPEGERAEGASRVDGHAVGDEEAPDGGG